MSATLGKKSQVFVINRDKGRVKKESFFGPLFLMTVRTELLFLLLTTLLIRFIYIYNNSSEDLTELCCVTFFIQQLNVVRCRCRVKSNSNLFVCYLLICLRLSFR